jgi:hypothetical protein
LRISGIFQNLYTNHEILPLVSQGLRVKAGFTPVQGIFWKDRIFFGGPKKAKKKPSHAETLSRRVKDREKQGW